MVSVPLESQLIPADSSEKSGDLPIKHLDWGWNPGKLPHRPYSLSHGQRNL